MNNGCQGYEQTFEDLIWQIQREKMQQSKVTDIDKKARTNYMCFMNWARLFNNQDYSEKSFKKYMSSGDGLSKNIPQLIIKRIYEIYYNYEFEWDRDKNKWNAKKRIKK